MATAFKASGQRVIFDKYEVEVKSEGGLILSSAPSGLTETIKGKVIQSNVQGIEPGNIITVVDKQTWMVTFGSKSYLIVDEKSILAVEYEV